MIPSVETIKSISKSGSPIDASTAAAIRKLMEDAESTGYSFAHPHRAARIAMNKIDSILGGCGVEFIPAGTGNRSPSIRYVNLGDTYDATVLHVRGQFRIGSWGDIVERGNYA
jgi:hypothetical protein